MVLESEASCPKCFSESQYSISLAKTMGNLFFCRYGHKFKEESSGYLKQVE